MPTDQITVKVYSGKEESNSLKLQRASLDDEVGQILDDFEEFKNIHSATKTIIDSIGDDEIDKVLLNREEIIKNLYSALELVSDITKNAQCYSTHEGKKIEKWFYQPPGQTIKFFFWAFEGSLLEGKDYASVQLAVPLALLQAKLPKASTKKIKYAFADHKFLIQPSDKRFLEKGAFDHGRNGCPVAPGTGGGVGLIASTSNDGVDENHDNIRNPLVRFVFNENYFHPMLMPNWQVCYHITEQEDFWDPYDPESHNISIEEPMQYDTTLGIYFTRGIEFKWKKAPVNAERLNELKRNTYLKEFVNQVFGEISKEEDVKEAITKLKKAFGSIVS